MTKFSQVVFESINDVTLSKEQISDFSVIEHDIRLDCRLNTKIQNDYLIVAPNGAVDREKLNLPVFARWNYHSIFSSTILSISDPVLLLDDSLRIGWFAGTKSFDVADFTSKVVVEVAKQLGIASDRIIFWGSSSGGFASILLASKIDGASFVSINGQSKINDYYSGHVEDYRKVFDSESSTDQIIQDYPLRWSILNALSESYDQGRATKGVVVQNTIDEMHYLKHYTPFCEKFYLPVEGGKSNRYELWSLLFENQKGHGPEPADIAKQVVEEYLPKILGENK